MIFWLAHDAETAMASCTLAVPAGQTSPMLENYTTTYMLTIVSLGGDTLTQRTFRRSVHRSVWKRSPFPET